MNLECNRPDEVCISDSKGINMNLKNKNGQEAFLWNFLNVLFENMQCGCCLLTMEEEPEILEGNENAYQILGYEKKKLKLDKQNRFLDIVYMNDRERMQQCIYELLLFDIKKTVEVRIVRQDSQFRWLNFSLEKVCDPEGKRIILATFVDITENIDYQKEMDHITETIASGLAKLCFIEEKIEVLYANHSFYEMWSNETIRKGAFFEPKSYEQFIGRPLSEDSIQWPKMISFEYPSTNASGEQVWIEVRGVYSTRNKDYPTYIFVFNDITKLKCMEEEINILRNINRA